MTSSFLTGRQGKLSTIVDDGKGQDKFKDIAKVTAFTAVANLETLETTALDDKFRTYTPGVVSYSGSASLLYFIEPKAGEDGAFDSNANILLGKLFNASGVSSTFKLSLRFANNPNEASVKGATFDVYITSASYGVSVGDTARIEITFQSTGAVSSAAL